MTGDTTQSWYEIASGNSIAQGDIIYQTLVVDLSEVDPEASEGQPVRWRTIDAIVLSQTCDIVNDKVSEILLCPVLNLESIEGFLKQNKARELARQSALPHYHMLSASTIPGLERPISIVDFRLCFTLPVSIVIRHAARAPTRLRLVSPYREHLSQAFARLFMRAALPAPIPQFKT